MFRRRHQVFADSGDFIVNILVQHINIATDTVVQINADGNGSDVEMLVGNHFDSFEYLATVEIVHGLQPFLRVIWRIFSDGLQLNFKLDIHMLLRAVGSFSHLVSKHIRIFFH